LVGTSRSVRLRKLETLSVKVEPMIAWPEFAASDAELDVITKLSRYYGSDPTIVLAGGGNTSCKTDKRLFVKASGTSLATMTAEGFVAMDRERLQELSNATLDADPDTREAQFKAAISAARCEPERGQRPSVEVLLHHLLPQRYVVHSHATIGNTLTCSKQGRKLAEEVFGDSIVWLPYVDPGFILAQSLKQALAEHAEKTQGAAVKAILMANHGLIVAGDDPDAIRGNTNEILEKISARLGGNWQPDAFGPPTLVNAADEVIRVVGPALRGLLADGNGQALKIAAFDGSPLVQSLVGTAAGKTAATAGPLTPDQIVYCGSYPLWFEPIEGETEAALVARLRAAIAEHKSRTRFVPKVVLVAGAGLFTIADDIRQANTIRDVYLDAVKVMAGATRLGGISYLTDRERLFIEDWEVESYRRSISLGSGAAGGKRLKGKVAVVTGAAQGFGLEIARGLAGEGAHVVLADVNEAGVTAAADELAAEHGAGAAVGLAMNVTDGESIQRGIDRVVRTYGGFDVFISNAGVLRAESVKTQSEKDFDFVTDVNYKGYFLCVKHAAPVLATQHRAAPEYWSDIIQINSKSGLAGSKKNFAYAGSKFGGIGLTQSFALELVEDGVKVNSVCPGNFLDGPLWSDPEKGLFVQYLRAGKVPGATTVADVKRAYEEKVPMGRGCTTADVLRAILYLIEQRYETGQALPVTGGQEMLR
jgi:rhamnose utilization protein RhaD (predicted bifunctional aldolase and dehydrogenase)/NAD(P)-dependent dehydrogenase (short-subunit alcohol dehydrogenase family)